MIETTLSDVGWLDDSRKHWSAQHKAFFLKLQEHLRNVESSAEVVLMAEAAGDDRAALGEGLSHLSDITNLFTFIASNVSKSYLPTLKEAVKHDSAFEVDEHGRNMDPALYEGKYFYEVVPDEHSNNLTLVPIEGLYYAADNKDGYKYIQVLDGKVTAALREDQVLVSDRKL